MKIKEITEGVLSTISDVIGRNVQGDSYWLDYDQPTTYNYNDQEEQGQQPTSDTTDSKTQKKSVAKPQTQKKEPVDQTQQTSPKDNPNATLKSKIDYLVKQGKLASARITDDEKRYIDSVDVYVDRYKFANVDPSEKFIKSKPPHHSLTFSSVQIPMSEWQRALGRDGTGLSGYVNFDLTDAGWWSNDFNAYINPNNSLDELVASYQKD